jgi:hypothetical protein
LQSFLINKSCGLTAYAFLTAGKTVCGGLSGKKAAGEIIYEARRIALLTPLTG